MKRTLSLFIIVLLLANTFGFELFFAIELNICKKESEKAIFFLAEKDVLDIIKIKKDEQQKIINVDENEIRYNNNLYDIVKAEETNSEIIYYCYKDVKENNLIRGFREVEKEQKNNRTKKGEARFVLKNLVKNYIVQKIKIDNPLNNHFKFSLIVNNNYESPLLSINPHPPQSNLV